MVAAAQRRLLGLCAWQRRCDSIRRSGPLRVVRRVQRRRPGAVLRTWGGAVAWLRPAVWGLCRVRDERRGAWGAYSALGRAGASVAARAAAYAEVNLGRDRI